VWTLFTLMEQHAESWKKIRGSDAVETFGLAELVEPEPIEISLDLLIYNYKVGFQHFGTLWKELLSPGCYEVLYKLAGAENKGFVLPMECWARMLYELAAIFHHWPINRTKLIDVISPLYNARIASFVNETASMKSLECEKVVEEQAEMFEREKGYLVQVWDREDKKAEEKSFFQKVLGNWRPQSS